MFTQYPASPDHLCPPDSLLELHQPLLVLVALHQDPGHLHTGEAPALGNGNVVLQRGGALLQPTKDGMGLRLVPGKSGDRHIFVSSSVQLDFTPISPYEELIQTVSSELWPWTSECLANPWKLEWGSPPTWAHSPHIHTPQCGTSKVLW